MSFLRVKNWERYQHYKDRRPPWIKYHVELLDDHGLQLLDLETRLVFSLLLLVAARTDNNIPSDYAYIARQVAVEAAVVQGAVESLVNAGFLVTTESKRAASKALAKRKPDASAVLPLARSRETEAYTEKKERAHTRRNDNGDNPTSAGAFIAISTMVMNGAITNEVDLEAEIRAQRLVPGEARDLRAALKRRMARVA